MMTLYHSSAQIKKVMSEQFLNQLKIKTEVDNIKWQIEKLHEKESRVNLQRDQLKRRKLNGSGEKTAGGDSQMQSRPAQTVKQLVDGIHAESVLDSENHPSGANGLSFCPFHKLCPDYHLKSAHSLQVQSNFRRKASSAMDFFDLVTEEQPSKEASLFLQDYKNFLHESGHNKDKPLLSGSDFVMATQRRSHLIFVSNPFVENVRKNPTLMNIG